MIEEDKDTREKEEKGSHFNENSEIENQRYDSTLNEGKSKCEKGNDINQEIENLENNQLEIYTSNNNDNQNPQKNNIYTESHEYDKIFDDYNDSSRKKNYPFFKENNLQTLGKKNSKQIFII